MAVADENPQRDLFRKMNRGLRKQGSRDTDPDDTRDRTRRSGGRAHDPTIPTEAPPDRPLPNEPRAARCSVREMQVTDFLASEWVLIAVMIAVCVAGCSSDPSPKRVARDIIISEAERNPGLDEECLLSRLKEFPEDRLSAVDAGLRSDDEAERAAAESTLHAYELSLAECIAPETSD